MNPIQNLVLRAARQINEYIIQVIDSREPGSAGDTKTLTHLETTLFQTLFDNLKPGYPDHYVAEPGESLISSNSNKTKEHKWFVGGFDQAQLFGRRLPTCSYSITHFHNEKVIDALVINPFTGEEFTASRGNGAALNNRRIRCSSERSLERVILTTNLLSKKARSDNEYHIKDLIGDLNLACETICSTNNPALDAAMVASGQVDAAILYDIDPSQIEGSLLISQESGALAGTLSGDIIKDQKRCNLVIANPKLYKSIIQRYRGYDQKLTKNT